MIITPEIDAGFVLTSAVVTIFTVLAAFEVGRLVTRDEDQRQVEITVDDTSRFRRAA